MGIYNEYKNLITTPIFHNPLPSTPTTGPRITHAPNAPFTVVR